MFTLILSTKNWIVQYHFVLFTHNSFLCANIYFIFCQINLFILDILCIYTFSHANWPKHPHFRHVVVLYETNRCNFLHHYCLNFSGQWPAVYPTAHFTQKNTAAHPDSPDGRRPQLIPASNIQFVLLALPANLAQPLLHRRNPRRVQLSGACRADFDTAHAGNTAFPVRGVRRLCRENGIIRKAVSG